MIPMLRFSRKPCVIGLILFMQSLVVTSQDYSFQTWNQTNNSTVFTVTPFRSVTVDKLGNVWAGSDLGGLYKYDGTTWTKANTYGDVTFRHLVPSYLPGDTNVWATSIGKTGVQAITGGVYLINPKLNTVTQYGSGVAGGLSSRYANSLAMSNGVVYAALAQSLTGSTTLQGGVYKMSMINPPAPSSSSFTAAITEPPGQDVAYQSAGNRGTEMWFGRSGYCVSGTCYPARIERLDRYGVGLTPITNLNSPLPFTASGTSAFARAIFTDTITGNTYVGLSGGGGVGVMKADGTWKLLTTANSGFPSGASVNFNAIGEVYGEIWIGTTGGTFVYKTWEPLDSLDAFDLLTTVDGMPNNSITDIAVDTARADVWLTSASGVSRWAYVPPAIRGTVFDVFTGKPDATFHPSIQKIAMKTGMIAELYENGNKIETTPLDDNGNFELTETHSGTKYKVVVRKELGDKDIEYVFDNVNYDSLIGEIWIPDSLIRQIKTYGPTLEKKCFPFELPFGGTIPGFEACRDGYVMTDYLKPVNRFYNGTDQKHQLLVENLANYYVTMATMYNIGINSTELMQEMFISCLDAIHSLFAFLPVGTEFGRKAGATVGGLDKDEIGYIVNLFKIIKEGLVTAMNTAVSFMDEGEAKATAKKNIGYVNDAVDLGLQLIGNGKTGAALNTALDIFKKIVATEGTATTYKAFCRNRHEFTMTVAANNATQGNSAIKYPVAYANLFDPNNPASLSKKSADILATSKETSADLRKTAKVADAAAGFLDAFSALAIAAGPQAAAIAKGLAYVAKGVQTVALAASMVNAGIDAINVADISSTVNQASDLDLIMTSPDRQRGWMPPSNVFVTKHNTLSLQSANTDLKNKLLAYKLTVNAPYNQPNHSTAFRNLIKADSAYMDELSKTMQGLWASADSANLLIPGFKQDFNRINDSFTVKSSSYREAIQWNRYAYVLDTDKAPHAADISAAVDSIVIMLDSTAAGVARLANAISQKGIISPGFLSLDAFTMNHNNLPGAPGSFTYRFTNYGGKSLTGVYFKIADLKGGFAITSADSIFHGTIAPGGSAQVSFQFSSPNLDTLGRYNLQIGVTSGNVPSISGSLITSAIPAGAQFTSVKNGNWNDPATWDRNAVPALLDSVIIGHHVTVTANAQCKSIKANAGGTLTVQPGVRLDLLQ